MRNEEAFKQNTVWWHTPAKVNLYLELIAKRPDGFHELETVMIAISLYDSIALTPDESGSISLHLDLPHDDQHPSFGSSQIEEDCETESDVEALNVRHHSESKSAQSQAHVSIVETGDVPLGSDNIVVQAVELLRQSSGTNIGAKIRLTKRIPSQAGLGGASSDAAAAIQLANKAWGLNWSSDRLAELAADLGSDIPFFFGTGAAVCRGRGEIIDPIDNVPGRLELVVVKPPVGLSTPEVFRVCTIPKNPKSSHEMIRALRMGQAQRIAASLHNRLEPAANQLTDWIVRLAKQFESLNCLGHGMSGSGSSYFGIFPSSNDALYAANQLRKLNVGLVFPAHSINRWGEELEET